MTDKIIRGDGLTELAGIKDCVYTERVNAEENLRPGCAAAAGISVEVYGSQASAVNAGEELTYYQVDSNGNETLIGKFYAEPSVPTKSTYRFTAYDAAAKLDTDFSERLWSISADFPMTVKDIVEEACDVAGVTLGSTIWPLSDLTVKEFFSDGVTCRQIVSWAAEIACCYVRCDTSGDLVFDWYTAKSGYEIRPGSGTSGGTTYVPYKQNGLNYENYNISAIQYVAVRPIDTEGVAYIYPSTFVDVTATDPDNNGNIQLADISAADDGTGNISVSSFINISDDGNGNLTIANSGSSGGNTLVIYDNLLLVDADTATMTAVAQNIFTRMTAIGTYRPATVNLFPFDCPFRAGDIVAVTDIQGVAFNTVVMEMRVSRAVTTVSSTGSKEQKDVPVNSQSRMARLGENIVRIKNLVVESLQAVEARIQNLFAENITATGSFEVDNGVYYLTQTTDGFELGSVDNDTEPPTASTKISANSTDGVTLQTFLNRGITITTVGSRGNINLRTGNFGVTNIEGGLAVDSIRIGNDYVKPILTKTVIYTSNGNGLANLSLGSTYGVLYVRRTDATAICTPYYAVVSDGWWVRLTDINGNIIASTAVTLEVGYYDKTVVI